MSQEDKNLNAFISAVERLYKLVPGGRPTENGFDRDFQELKTVTAELKKTEEHKGLIGQKPENRKKNRYKDITPFDDTRVKLTVTNDDPFSDYINASFIKGAEGHQNYIASQGPLPHTVLDFWQMLWQYNVAVIVMVCREIELGKKKCERYWAEQDSPKNFGGITVSLQDKQDLKDGYCLRTIKAQKGSETRYIQQFHYTSWPDHGVPKTCSEIITLINHVRDVQSYSKDKNAPLCVHCSAGCGRTGAVLAVDYARNLLDKKNVPPSLKMFDVISEMRKQRPAIVQTKEQYEFVNTAVSEMFRVYMQTRTLSFKEFRVGYEGEQYVNINITSEDKSKDKRNGIGPARPTTLTPSYENIDIKSRPKTNSFSNGNGNGSGRKVSPEEYPDNSPPAKPPLRPFSVLLPDSFALSNNNPAYRKQSVPAILVPNTDGKQSSPSIITSKKGPPTPAMKPRIQNANNLSALSPTARSRSASGSPMPGKDGKPPPPSGKPKPNKPEPAPKNFSTAPALKSPGNTPPISPLHGDSAPTLSSSNKTKSSLSSPAYGNIDFHPKNEHSPVPPAKPQIRESMKSPLHEKRQKFEKSDAPNTAPLLRTPPRRKPIDLKIREDTDAPTDSESDSPAVKGHFILPNMEKHKPAPPAVSPKPKIPLKPSTTKMPDLRMKLSSESVDKRDSQEPKKLPEALLRCTGKPKTQPMRPLSQNFISLGLPASKRTGLSSSVYDLTEADKKVPPPVSQKTMVIRSASISAVNSAAGEKSAFLPRRAKPSNTESRDGELGPKDVHIVKVIGFTQADGSYGPVFAATAKSVQSDKNRPSHLQWKSPSYQVQTPKPFKPQSRHSISKLNTSAFPDPTQNHTPVSSPKKTPPPRYENTDIHLNKEHHAPASGLAIQNAAYEPTSIRPSETSTEYVNADQSNSPTKRKPSSQQYENQPIRSKVEGNGGYENAPPFAASQDSNPKPVVTTLEPTKEHKSNVQNTHGFVSRTSEEGAIPKALEEVKKKAPLKPKRSMRIKSTEGAAKSGASPMGASKSPLRSNFQKYDKKNSGVAVNESTGTPQQLIIESQYQTFTDHNAIPRSNSNASADRSPTNNTPLGPPKLPARTAESQILVSESPPELPSRTKESYQTLEVSDAMNETQGYEAVDTSASSLPPPAAKSLNAENGRRQSNASASGASSGTNFFSAKAKNMIEKTSNAFSKVTSKSKSSDDDSSGSSPATIENRTPTYAPVPVMYGGQDMSFGKRLKNKVRGGRKLK